MFDEAQSKKSNKVRPAICRSLRGPKDREHSTPRTPHTRNIHLQAADLRRLKRSISQATPTSMSDTHEVMAATTTARKNRVEITALSSGTPEPISAKM